tara:strand:- start:338 stop:1021 length:684 start_codon:yes stop_codon:yes gene_type:complete
MVILFDADSLVYSSCINVEDDFEQATAKFDEILMSIVNRLEEEGYDIKELIVFNASRGNFRKVINKTYKANRTSEPPALLHQLHKHVSKVYGSKNAYGIETDDLVSIYWNRLQKEIGRENVIIVALDKDYKQLPCLFYNYHVKHQKIFDIDEVQAMKNFYTQMIVGDGADNINYCYGYGIKYAEKIFKNCKTKYQFIKQTFLLYKKIYKSKAREKFIMCHRLLKLEQ